MPIYGWIILALVLGAFIYFLFIKKKKKVVSHFIHKNNVSKWRNLEIDTLVELNRVYQNNLTPDKTLREETEKRIAYYISLIKPKASHNNDTEMRERLHSLGIRVVGECIGNLYHSAKDLVYGWEHSSEHDEIFKDPKYKYVGISFVEYEGKTLICCIVGKI